MARLGKLLEPVRIGKLELRNRIVMAPINSHLGTELGGVNDRLLDYYVERARGGVGLIITDAMCIDWPVGKAGTSPLRTPIRRFTVSTITSPYAASSSSEGHTGPIP